MDSVLDDVRSSRRHAPHIAAWRRLPAQAPQYADWPQHLDDRIVDAARERGFERPYTHQAQAIDAVLRGEHVVVVTPTASGKTLAYSLPALHTLLNQPAARALYLFPTKALAHDQLAELRAWNDILDADLRPASYDGDTPASSRPKIRRQARIVVSNPDMLHVGILPHHTKWSELFRNLRFVVLDEIHTYRGVFGSHTANVVRRLRRIARFYGSDPQFVCCSATIANPVELAERLTEVPVTLVDDDGSPKGERHVVFYNPPIVDQQLGIRRSAVQETEQLARHFLQAGVQTIVFTRARQTTELLLRYLQTSEVIHNSQLTIHNSQLIRGYRGGYRPNERREIEAGLRDGTIRGVVSTNALELGIDIGQLDACLMAGYPGTIASTWQQAGRAGRRAGVSAAVLVASGGPLDQYIVKHPDYFFEQSPEHGLINPDNLLILLDHLRCAAFELPFEAGEAFGDPLRPQKHHQPSSQANRAEMMCEILDYLVDAGDLHRVGDVYYWMSDNYPAEGVSLRSAGPDNVVIVDATNPEQPQALGTVERSSAPQTVHEGAVYLHDGDAYLIDRLDWEAGQAFARAVDADYYTRASVSVDVRPADVFDEQATSGADVGYGEVQVTSKATSFRKVRFYTQETLGWGDIELPEQTMLTTGYWFALDEATVERLREAGWWQFDPVGYRGPNWQQQRDAARKRDGYVCRHCDAPERPDRQHDIHHLQPFRDFGYVAGENERYRAANQLDNLITLCRACHRKAENAQRFQGALTGLGHVLGHVAPLFLMCDYRDIGIQAEAQAAWSKRPTVTVYERAPAGVGFSEMLFRLHGRLLSTAQELIRDCACDRGCPSCVGPVGEVGEDAKAYTLVILAELVES
ncbi:MAG: putative ATP-dependent RNA helicase YfmL [Anaerolineales bacterium]|nr:putative ATP-dependent RNA helicase YfmL [Anaerolineales bacterium]